MTGPEPAEGQVPYLGMRLGGFLDALAAGRAAPGGGCAAALAVALGASLCAMAARLSVRHLVYAADLAAQADRLRDHAASLCQADARSYGQVLAALRHAPEHGPELASALSAAAQVPMTVAETGAQVARIAARLARHGNPNLRGDAITAALLAEAGARAAGMLTRMNLAEASAAGAPPGEAPARVARLLRNTARWAARAQQQAPSRAAGGRGAARGAAGGRNP